MTRPKAAIPFAPWEPDTGLVSGKSADAKGVISLAGGRFGPDKDFLALKAGAALASRALGGVGVYDVESQTSRVFVGDQGHLYEIAASLPVDKSKIGGYAANPDWAWSFEQFGPTVLATARGLSQIQSFDLDTSTVFADVATGPGPSDGLFRVREFIFSGYTDPANGVVLKNCAFNNFTDWVPDSGTQAGTFTLPSDGGQFIGGVGGQFAIVFQEKKIHRLTYQGGAAPFQRDEIEDKRGCIGPNAFARYGEMTFFVSDDGFRVTDGNQSTSIAQVKTDKYFLSRLNYAQRTRVSLAVDVGARILRVIFPTGGNATPDHMMIYSMDTGQWTHDDCALDLIFEAPRPGISIDDDAAILAVAGSSIIDEVAIPINSSVWLESRKQIMSVANTGEVGTFAGSNRAATIETGYGEVMPGRKGFVSEVWPITDANTCSAIVTTKLSRLGDSEAQTSISAMNTVGFCPLVVEARFLKAQIQIPSGTDWTEISGITTDAGVSGEL